MTAVFVPFLFLVGSRELNKCAHMSLRGGCCGRIVLLGFEANLVNQGYQCVGPVLVGEVVVATLFFWM